MSAIMQQLGRFFLIECQSKTGSYLMECDDLPRGYDNSEETAIELLRSFDDVIAIYEVCEGKFSDVSKHIAEVWLGNLCETYNPETDEWPDFIQRHISPIKLMDIEAEARDDISSDREHVRSWQTPLL